MRDGGGRGRGPAGDLRGGRGPCRHCVGGSEFGHIRVRLAGGLSADCRPVALRRAVRPRAPAAAAQARALRERVAVRRAASAARYWSVAGGGNCTSGCAPLRRPI